MTDAELIHAIQAGDTAALTALYDRCLPVVWRYVYRQLGGDIQTAEDVVSETFLVAIDSVRRLDPEGGTLCGWLLGVARHKIVHHRRRCRGSHREEAASESEAVFGVEGSTPPALLEASEEAAEVMGVLDQLADEERVVLEWKYLDSCSVREIADRLGRTAKAVENLLYRARQSFRSLYRGRQNASRRGPGRERP